MGFPSRMTLRVSSGHSPGHRHGGGRSCQPLIVVGVKMNVLDLVSQISFLHPAKTPQWAKTQVHDIHMISMDLIGNGTPSKVSSRASTASGSA